MCLRGWNSAHELDINTVKRSECLFVSERGLNKYKKITVPQQLRLNAARKFTPPPPHQQHHYHPHHHHYWPCVPVGRLVHDPGLDHISGTAEYCRDQAWTSTARWGPHWATPLRAAWPPTSSSSPIHLPTHMLGTPKEVSLSSPGPYAILEFEGICANVSKWEVLLLLIMCSI